MGPGNRLTVAALVVIALLPIARPAHAYLDPATGSMILNIILGGIAGLVITAKLYWTRIKEFFGYATAVADEDSTHPDTDDSK